MSSKESKQKKRARMIQQLNTAGERWYKEKAAGNNASVLKEAATIFELAYQLFTEYYFAGISNGKIIDPALAINDFYTKYLDQFNPTRSPLFAFMDMKFKYQIHDIDHKDHSGRTRTITDPETGKKTKTFVADAPIYGVYGDDGSQETDRTAVEPFSQPWSEPEEDSEEKAVRKEKLISGDQRMIALLSEFCSLILNLSEHLRGKANNPEKRRYYRMFFTDIMSMYMKKQKKDLALVQRRETDVFQAMICTFLDFYMSKECRTCLSVYETKLKNYSELVDGKPEEEPQEIYNDIYISYLDRIEKIQVGDASISNQWESFRKLIIDALGIDIVSVHTTKKNKYRTTTFLIGD